MIGVGIDEQGESDHGSVYVIFGRSGTFNHIDLLDFSAHAGFVIEGASPGDFTGLSIASAGDFDGDGYDDIIVCAPGSDIGGENEGAAYLIFGKADGFDPLDVGALAAEDGFAITGARRVETLGDVNADGLGDVALFGDGGTYVVFGRAGASGPTDLDTLAADGFQIGYNPAGGHVTTLGSAGDIDGHGRDDIIVGRSNAAGTSAASYVIFGRRLYGRPSRRPDVRSRPRRRRYRPEFHRWPRAATPVRTRCSTFSPR